MYKSGEKSYIYAATTKEISSMSEKKTYFPPDIYYLFSCVSYLTILGLLMSFSASFPFAAQHYSSGLKLFLRQLLSLGIAISVSLLVYHATKRISLRKLWFLFWTLSIVLVLMTFISGYAEEAKGAARWLNFGFIRFQPSELLKLAIIIAAAHLGLAYVGTKERYYFVTAVSLIVLSSFLVLLQRDMTTAVIIFLAGTTALFVLPISLKDLSVLAVIAVFGAFFGVVAERYRFVRLLVFLDPWKAGDAGRQVVVSLLALARGGVSGVGIGRSIFKYNVLPEAHTDFIFTIIGSELGLIGSLTVILCLLALLLLGFRVSNKIKDEFARSVSLAIIAMLAFQSIINIGGTLQVLPPTGIPLPFVSFGGTALVVSYVSLAIICGLWMRSEKDAQNSGGRRGN